MQMIRMTIRQLEYFEAVVETGSATAAAKVCHVSQAGLSSGILQLETALNVQLFVRQKSRNLTLTPAGRAFGKSVQSVLQQLQELEDGAASFGRSVSGILRLGCFESLSPTLLPQLASYFVKEHPQVTLRFLEGHPRAIEDDLRAGRCEGILIYKQHVSSDLISHTLGSHPLYVALPVDHDLVNEESIDLEQLAAYPHVLLDQEPIGTLVTNLLRNHGIESEPILTSRSIETIRSAVAHGLGFTVTGVRPPHDLSFDGLPIAYRPLAGGGQVREIVLCTMPGAPMSRRLSVALERCRALVNATSL